MKFKEKVSAANIKENRYFVVVLDIDYLYKIYDLLSIRQDKHKMVFCFFLPLYFFAGTTLFMMVLACSMLNMS